VALKVSKDQQVPKENRVFKDHKDLRVFKVFRAKRVRQDPQAIPVFMLEQPNQARMLKYGLTQKVKP
jgi:hypothetical protein